jgi:hypothetical protein
MVIQLTRRLAPNVGTPVHLVAIVAEAATRQRIVGLTAYEPV